MHSLVIPLLTTFFGLTAVASVIPHANHAGLGARAILQGWSLQSQQCPSNTQLCGGVSCCPSSLYCQQTGNGEVWACCPSSSNCRGAVEGNPTCADSSWSLWKGNYGNGFCCVTNLIGAYIGGGSTAGTCVTAVPAGQTSAVLMSRGSGGSGTTPSTTTTSASSIPKTATTTTTSKITTTTTKITTTSPTTTTATTTAATSPTGKAGKPVFMHYLIGGISEDHCKQDLADASRLGVDAFALNFDRIEDYSTSTTKRLFDNAATYNIKLFFSFDFAPGIFTDPSQFQSFLKPYLSHQSHFKYNGKPLVSTFGGTSVSDSSWNNFKSGLGTEILLIPGVYNQGPQDGYLSSHSSWNGLFNWESWPTEGSGKVTVSSADDTKWKSQAQTVSKLFMMGMSPIQFKHLSSQNYYRRGEANLENRMGQVLALQPDMLEIQTWNDAGESHYMGNSWPDPISGAPEIQAYTNDYPHQGYWEILPSFIQAWKRGDTDTSKMYPTNGKAAQGTFWHHTLLVDGDCSSDRIGKPNSIQTDAEDLVSGIILVAQGQSGLSVTATSGGKQLGSQQLNAGFNKFAFGGLSTGTVQVQVKSGSSIVVQGSGPIAVTNSANLCNYNFQVVGLGS